MARNPRHDAPGVWHHAMNRGIARRTVFETRGDVRVFLARLARAVRRGEIEVHAFCVMTTHFHLLVRSPRGRLSEALRRVQNEYVRRFNRSRRRDGPLFRGRFRSKPVDSMTYRRTLVRYIDDNPVAAGVVPTPQLYPHGSARLFAERSGPPWLERSWIEETVRVETRRPYDGRGYRQIFGGAFPDHLRELIELRTRGNRHGHDPLDELVEAAPGDVRSWMVRKARLADGTRPNLPVCDPSSVGDVIEGARSRRGDWPRRPGQKPIDGWLQLQIGLLGDLCALTSAQIGALLSLSESGVGKARARHRAEVLDEGEYSRRAGELAAVALERCGVRPGKTVVELS